MEAHSSPKEETMKVLETWIAGKLKGFKPPMEKKKEEDVQSYTLGLWKSVVRYVEDRSEEPDMLLKKEDVYLLVASVHSEADASSILSRLKWDSVPFTSSVVASCNPYMGHRLLLRSDYDLKRVISWIVENYPCDFCWSIHFDPNWVRELMAEGFLPITSEIGLPRSTAAIEEDEAELAKLLSGTESATRKGGEEKKKTKKKKKRSSKGTLAGVKRRRKSRPTSAYIMLPKLHQSRCVIFPIATFHVQKTARKRSKGFELSVDQDFEGVVKGCRAQHGMNWLSPPIVESFREMVKEQTFTKGEAPHAGVTLHSFELWDTKTGKLVAGELGYSVVDKIYTSLTGFSSASGAGTIQLCCTGRLLAARGFALWDLGMFMEYKKNLGAKQMARKHFVRALQRIRVRGADATRTAATESETEARDTQGTALRLTTARANARQVIDRAASV
eukprot:g3727.t1